MHKQSLHELAHALSQGKFSSRELTQHYLNRIQQHKALNAFISVDEELALASADAADLLLKTGKAKPLTGIPMAHKDIFCTKSLATTCGSKMLANFQSPYEATIVAKLREQGAVLLGKTNMDEFAMGSANENSYFGPVKNPWDPDRVPEALRRFGCCSGGDLVPSNRYFTGSNR